jgi:hypothetical protein
MQPKTKLATLVMSLIVVGTLLPSHAYGQACNATTIAGSYGLRYSYFLFSGPGRVALPTGSSVPAGAAGRIVFTPNSPTSEEGTLTGFQNGNDGGSPLFFEFTGTYSVNSDCTGTLTRLVNGSLQISEWQLVIVQGGAEIEFSLTTAITPRTGEGVMKKQ